MSHLQKQFHLQPETLSFTFLQCQAKSSQIPPETATDKQTKQAKKWIQIGKLLLTN